MTDFMTFMIPTTARRFANLGNSLIMGDRGNCIRVERYNKFKNITFILCESHADKVESNAVS